MINWEVNGKGTNPKYYVKGWEDYFPSLDLERKKKYLQVDMGPSKEELISFFSLKKNSWYTL